MTAQLQKKWLNQLEKKLMTYNIGVVGCGKIFSRHFEAINQNKKYNLVSVCDTDELTLLNIRVPKNVKKYKNYRNMIDKEDINFVVIASPNAFHFDHCIYALENGCDALIEKPAVLNPKNLDILQTVASNHEQKIYAVLQVRLNPAVQNLKYLIDNNLIGGIRGFNLTQRWQRPKEYFDDWRGKPKIGGGILHECGIHYLDILCYLLGKPSVAHAKTYNTKHKNVDIEDTLYANLDFGEYGGNIEITIASEPHNLECSLSLLTDIGYIKLGGKAMNVVEDIKFNSEEKTIQINNFMNFNNKIVSPNSYGSYAGSCPNHPNLYNNIENFNLQETKKVLQLITEIYDYCKIQYF